MVFKFITSPDIISSFFKVYDVNIIRSIFTNRKNAYGDIKI